MTHTRPAPPFAAAALLVAGLLVVFANTPAANTAVPESTGGRLVAALLAETPLTDDLRSLTREIGGRPTGSDANLRAVEWGLERFREAGVDARRESFEMPGLWLEKSSSVTIRGEKIHFAAAAAAMPFSTAAPTPGVTAPLLDAGTGSAADFVRLGALAKGAFLLVETVPLLDVPGLFREYNDAYAIEGRAVEANARGVVYMSSRPEGILYRHNSSLRGDDARPMLVLERGAATRALDLLRLGSELSLTAVLDLEIGPSYESYNVIGEIRGSSKPEEVVLIGAHLDSWDLGAGALDNGANVSLVIDIARQMQRLGIHPARTVRFALWNGEEQGLVGSYRYTETHEDELDDHIVAMSFDIGCGRISGFFTGGRPEILPTLERALEPVAGLGPFQQVDIPVVGTDNFDFMMHGVANLIGNQESAAYGPNYHAQSDRIDQCDLRTVRLNAAIVAAVTHGFANADISWGRQGRDEIEELIRSTDLEQQMRSFNVWGDWKAGRRGRRDRPGN
ncbi:MAG: M28 family peptidase [Acidobacteriota bacterium]|nr:M28 family peptidase [Acidobacteriota bacterium]